MAYSPGTLVRCQDNASPRQPVGIVMGWCAGRCEVFAGGELKMISHVALNRWVLQ